jgi:hypothetical protein
MKSVKVKLLMLLLTAILYFVLTAIATQIVVVGYDPDWLVRLVMVGALVVTIGIMFGVYRLAGRREIELGAHILTMIFVAALMKMIVGFFDGEFSVAYILLLVGFGVFYFKAE